MNGMVQPSSSNASVFSTFCSGKFSCVAILFVNIFIDVICLCRRAYDGLVNVSYIYINCGTNLAKNNEKTFTIRDKSGFETDMVGFQ